MKAAAFYSNSANTSQPAAGMKQSSDQTCPKGYSAVHCGVVYCLGILISVFVIFAVPQTAKAQYCTADWDGCPYTACSTTCGTGTQSYTCTDRNGCYAPISGSGSCSDYSGCCTADWDGCPYTACSTTCGTGTQSYTCTDRNGCYSPISGSSSCSDYSGCCDPNDITWGTWSACSNACGIGTRTISGTDACGGSHTDTEGCETSNTITWGEWSDCSNACGIGTRTISGTDSCGDPQTATEGCEDNSGCPVCDGRDKCGVVPGCDSYQNPFMCGTAPGYQACGTGTCDDGASWTRYCNPSCSDPNADCYSTPSCTVNINCNDHGGDAYCAAGGCPPTSCTGEGRCGAGGNCWTDCTSCQTPRHLECRNEMCQLVDGAGSNTCSTNSQCQPPPTGDPPKHLECRNEACVEIDGAGDNLCLGNANCDVPSKPTYSIIAAGGCISSPVTDPTQAVRINWTNPPFAVSWADISTDNTFATYYHKTVSGISTTAPAGFTFYNNSNMLIINPGTTYYARVSNSVGNSASTSFSIPFCAPVITDYECPFPGTTATITWTYSSSANHYAVNYGSGITHLSPGVNTISFPSTAGQTYNWSVAACNSSNICGNAATGSVFCDNSVAPWIKTTGGDVHTQLRLNTR